MMKMASLLLSVASGCFDCLALHLYPRKKQINNYSPTFITTPSRTPNPLCYVGIVPCLVIQSRATRLGLTRQTPKAPCTITRKRLTCIAHPVRKLIRLTPSTYLPTHWLDSSFFNNIQWEVSCVWCSRPQQTPFQFITCLCAPAFAPVEVSDKNELIGHSLSEIWDESVLQMMSVNPDEVHCPFVASTGSFSHCNNQKKPQVWIDHSMPYLFAAGESVHWHGHLRGA